MRAKETSTSFAWKETGQSGYGLSPPHANPPLRASTRPTGAAALELWIQRYGEEITEESRSQAAQLLQERKEY